MASGLTDEQLMAQLQQGRTEALDALYHRYSRKLYVFCQHTTRSGPGDAEDLVQDVFVRVIKAAHTFDPQRASLRTWLFRIARNRCIDLTRRRRLIRFIPIATGSERDSAEEMLVPQATLVDQGQHTEESMLQAAAIQAVRECITALQNDKERQAILLYYLGSKVYREIGEVLGESLSMARNRVKAAQDKVRHCLQRKGIDFTC
jgi:RNA polymerase sigma factor (sigma-70 family)